MDMVDRYVRAVAKALPEEQREDIIGELSEDIRSEMEDRQRELGRPLTQNELEALLRRKGNPLLVAAQYRQDQRSVAFGRQLIGPVLFPFYAKVLSFNLGLTFLVLATIFSVLAVSGVRISFNNVMSACLLQLFIQLGVVTLIFSLVQRHLTKHPDAWHLSGMTTGVKLDLNLERDIEMGMMRPKQGWGGNISRFESISIIVASAVAIAWITGVQNYPFLILGPSALFLKLAPIWHQIYFPVLLLTVAEIVRASINLARPDWVLFRRVAQILLHAGGLGVVLALLKAGTWVAAGDAGAVKDIAHTVGMVNQITHYALLATTILSASMLIFRLVDLARRWHSQSGTNSVQVTAKEGN